jgi:dihydrofolate reductase
MIVSMVVATGPKNEIGFQNKLLWHIPEDLKNFKKITSGKAIVMGRKTYESIGKPLPNRLNIVLTRDESFKAEGVSVIHDPLMAFDLALNHDDSEEAELMIIGGEEIFKIYLPYTQKIYLSEVSSFKGEADTFFPEINSAEWMTLEKTEHPEFIFKILTKES